MEIRFKKLNIFYLFQLYFFLKKHQEDKYNFNPHEYSLKKIIQNMISKDVYIIQLYKDKIVGYGMLRGWSEGYKIPTLGIIINNEYRGLGLSKIMMTYLHFLAKQKKSEKVLLKVKKVIQ